MSWWSFTPASPAAAPQHARYTAAGREVRCPVCQGAEFRLSRRLLRPSGALLFGQEGTWWNREVTNLECAACGHLLWFARPDAIRAA